ncbi:phosphatase PAP2 family protein [Chitinophaga lutea]
MESLLTWDLQMFLNINGRWINGFFDWLLPIVREPFIWAPLYLFLLVFVTYNFGWRGFLWIVFFLITFAICDQSSGFFKEFVGRLRPCRDPLISPYVRQLAIYCPMSGSFTSSHAANHFGVGMFCFVTLRPRIGKWAWLFFLWAAVIGYAQVYVGVHYPLDIVGGALLGLLAGSLSGGFFQRRIRLELEQTT